MDSEDNTLEHSTIISQYIASTDDLEDSNMYCISLVELMKKNDLTLLEFIQHLGPSLTSDNDLIRLKSLGCLVEVLEKLEGQVLSKQDVNVLLDFLLVKLDDKQCLINILRGLGILVKFNSFLPSLNNNISKLLEALLIKYDPRKNLAKTRYEAFNILNNILTYNLDFIQMNKDISDNFVKLFIHIATSEKDPRNLLLSFELNAKINKNFEFDIEDNLQKEFINDLFDVCFCYFPISFTPPKNDPYKITAEDLKGKLRCSIASQSLFAKDSFSSLNEKLTSTNPIIRNDVLKTLLLCVESYSSETIVEYWLTIWNALKFEILHNDVSIFKPFLSTIVPENYDESIEDTDDNKTLILTLVIISELNKRLAESDQHETFLSTITEELKTNLGLNTKTFKQSVLLLSTLASVSFKSFNFITKFLFSYSIWGKFFGIERIENEGNKLEVDKSEDILLNVSKQRDLIDNLGFIIIAYNVLINTNEEIFIENDIKNNELINFKDHLLIFMGQLLQCSSNLEKTLKCKIVQQLIKLMQTPYFLNEDESSLIFEYFNDNLNAVISDVPDNFHNDLVVKEIIGGLVSITSNESSSSGSREALREMRVRQVIDLILPVFMNFLNFDKSFEMSNIANILNTLEDLCVNYQLLEVLSIRLLNKLDSLSLSEIDDNMKCEIFEHIVELFNKAIYKTEIIKQFLTNSLYKNFVPRFLSLLINMKNLNHDISLIEASGELIGLIVKFTDKSKHQDILNDFNSQFLLGKKSIINAELPCLTEVPNYLISLFNRILSNLDKSAHIEGLGSNGIIPSIINLIYNIDDEYLRLCYLQYLSLLINKFLKSNESESIRIILESNYADLNSTKSVMDDTQIKKLEVMIWIIKSLIIRIDFLGIEFVQKIILLLESENKELKFLVSRSLNILFVELPIFSNQTSKIKGIISKVSNLNTRLLYEQKVFELILPTLTENYLKTKDEVYLSSLSLILLNVSPKILRTYIDDIFLLILNSLVLRNPTVLKASLSSLDIIIIEKTDLIIPHLSTIIPTLLKNITEGRNDEEIRILSLKCLLHTFKNVPYPQLIKYQSSTLKDLTNALDDPKRKVRKLCCDLRQLLYEIGK